MTDSFVQMEVSCSIGQLCAGKMTIDEHSCVLLRASVLVFLRDLGRFCGTMCSDLTFLIIYTIGASVNIVVH